MPSALVRITSRGDQSSSPDRCRLRGAMCGDEKLGGRMILMASRALAAAAQAHRTTTRGLRPHPVAGHGAGDHPLAGRDVRPRAGRVLGHDGSLRGDGGLPLIHEARLQGGRNQDLAARQGTGDRHAPQAAKGVRMYTGDDFNYAELIEGDAQGSRMRCWASSTPSRRRRRRRCLPGTERKFRVPRHRWRPRSPCRATSSRRRRASIRPAWCSWPGSTATRTTS